MVSILLATCIRYLHVCQPVCLGRVLLPVSACVVLARALCAHVPCTCVCVPCPCLRVYFVVHLFDMLHDGEFSTPQIVLVPQGIVVCSNIQSEKGRNKMT